MQKRRSFLFQKRALTLGLSLTLATLGTVVVTSPLAAQGGLIPEDLLDEADQLQATCRLVDPLSQTPVVVTGTNASESERYAAKELAEHLSKITGRQIETVAEGGVPQGRKFIAVGHSKLTQSYDTSALGIEQYIIDTKPTGIVIIGGRQEPVKGPDGTLLARDRGTLYGVYAFLESLGVRWYRPEAWGWHIPHKETIELPVKRQTSQPPSFIARTATRFYKNVIDINPDTLAITEQWNARQRANLRFVEDNRFGGQLRSNNNWHTHSGLIVTPAKYLKTHPEYFALVDGKRGNPGSGRLPQLCLGNPELQDVFAANVVALARKNPQWYMVPIDPEDGTQPARRMCACDLCKAMDDPAAPENMSNRVFGFANIVARKVAQELPDLKLALYAYSSHTNLPTKIDKLEPSIIVGLANINSWSDWSKKLTDPDNVPNTGFLQLAEGWGKIAPHKLWMRDYSAYGWNGPIPMYRLLQDRVQTYRKLGFEAIVWPTEANWGPQQLLIYFKLQLQWNPDLDLEKELDYFYTNYYGPAAEPMKAYHEKWMSVFEQSKLGSGISEGISSGGRGMHALCSPALVNELGGYLAEAKKLAAGQELYEKRLEGDSAGHEMVSRVSKMLTLKLTQGTPTQNARTGTTFMKSAAAEKEWEEFVAWLAKANQNTLNFEVLQNSDKGLATALLYMRRDILENGRYGPWDEVPFLKAQGFPAP